MKILGEVVTIERERNRDGKDMQCWMKKPSTTIAEMDVQKRLYSAEDVGGDYAII